jgi:5'-nucleotidase / UDP-sugar diphosphatase
MHLLPFFSWLLLSFTALAHSAQFKLTIMHTNDVHARLKPYNNQNQACALEEKSCYGGVAKRVTKVREIRKKKRNTLLLDAGDQFQGSIFHLKYQGDEASQFMNKMGYDAMALGNHEFDKGPEVLSRFIKSVRFPVLGANIYAGNDPFLKNLIKAYTTVNIGGQTIGLIGGITEDTKNLSHPGHQVRFLSIEAEIKKAVTDLKNLNVNKIILLSHSGIEKELEIAKDIDGIDIIVGGHSHTLLSNYDKAAFGPYPTVITSPSGTPVLVVTASENGKYLGQLDVEFDSMGNLTKWSGDPILLDNSVAADEETVHEVEILEHPIKKMQNETVAVLTMQLEGRSTICRYQECNLGDVLADAILKTGKPLGAQISLINAGTIRSSISPGKITHANVIDVLPFGNKISVFTLSGQDLWDILQFAFNFKPGATNEDAARFLQVSGLRIFLNKLGTYHFSLKSVEVLSESNSYVPLDKKRNYIIASNRFIVEQGDGFTLLKEKAKNVTHLSTSLDESFIDYLQANPSLAILDNYHRIMIQK